MNKFVLLLGGIAESISPLRQMLPRVVHLYLCPYVTHLHLAKAVDGMRCYLAETLVCKVTIRTDFTGTIPNFDGLSREKLRLEVSRDTELSQFRILSWFWLALTVIVTSLVYEDYTYRPNTPIQNSLSSDVFLQFKMHQIHFRPELRS